MKNLYKIRLLVVILLTLSTLTSKQAMAQSQWGHKKEWKIHSMGKYILGAEDMYREGKLFEERGDLILIGVMTSQPDKTPENTPLPNLTEFVIGNTQVNDPILIWSKKTKDFIRVKSNWTGEPLRNPYFIPGFNKNTFFIIQYSSPLSPGQNETNYLYRAKVIGDSIHYELLNRFFKHNWDEVRSICETEDKIVTIIGRFKKKNSEHSYEKYDDSVYVYDSKSLNLIKTVSPFGNYKNCTNWGSLVYDGKYFFLNAYQISSGDFGSFMLDLDVDTSCYIEELSDPFSEIYFSNLDGNIYALSKNRRVSKWDGSHWHKVVLPIENFGFPEKDQFGNYYYWTDNTYRNPKGKYFNPDSATLYGEYRRDYLLYSQDGGIWVLNEEQQVEYYQKFGYTWQPVRVVAVGTDTFMFGNNMVAKLVDRNVGINDVTLKKLFVYPNPATGFITVSTPEGVTFTVTDMTGKIVLTGATNQNVDVSLLNKGIYFVTISGYQPTKIVIQ